MSMKNLQFQQEFNIYTIQHHLHTKNLLKSGFADERIDG